ncbi:MAG: YdcF family protein [Anaerolineaceae bacterium]|nr:YdcF family protein [Anaerolineaceae bacterium]
MNNTSPQKSGCLSRTFWLSIKGLFGAVIVSVVFLAALEILFWGIGGFLIVADPVAQVDAAVILSGGDSTRIYEAAELYEERYINYVILTETGVEVPEWGTSYSNLMRFEAIESGIPANAILITEQHVDSTIDEARAARKLMQIHNLHSIIVITDPFHTMRTRLIFRNEFKESGISVLIRPVRNHWYRSDSWWLSLRGWQTTISEYIKLFGYVIGF